jgi:hypothetical protein
MRRVIVIGISILWGAIPLGSAQAGPAAYTQAQLVESGARAQALVEGFAWPPARVGGYLALKIGLKSKEEYIHAYLSAYQEAVRDLPEEGSEWKQIGAMAEDLWIVWQAENGIRWAYLRDTALAIFLILAPGAGLLFVVMRALASRAPEAPDKMKYKLAVTPDQPLDFILPQADPKQSSLYGLLEKEELLSPLIERVIALYAAFPEHPASIGDHGNAPGGLIEHVQRTLIAMMNLVKERSKEERKLYCLMALLHDVGKIVAYQKEGELWDDRRLFHDRLSGQIAASLPELYRELERADRNALITALRYYHSPDEIPTSSAPLAEQLVNVMHQADAVAHEEEREALQRQVNEIKPYLWEAFLAALPHLNINRINGGYPDGFTSEGLVFVLEHALREKTLDRLPEAAQRGLPIKRQTGRLHPAWPLLVEVLSERKILVTAVDGKKANPSALFNITANGTTYKCVVALSRTAVEAVAGRVTGKWQEYLSYEVKIAGGRHGEEEQRSG